MTKYIHAADETQDRIEAHNSTTGLSRPRASNNPSVVDTYNYRVMVRVGVSRGN
jgi:hypothetical protein